MSILPDVIAIVIVLRSTYTSDHYYAIILLLATLSIALTMLAVPEAHPEESVKADASVLQSPR